MIELKNYFLKIKNIWYSAKKYKIYTISNDRRFVACDVNYNSKINEINRNVHNYTKLCSDLKNNRLLTATDKGIIELSSLENYSPEKKCIIRTSGISDFYFNTNK